MRRHNSSPFRLPCHSYAEYQVISDYSDTSNDESHSTGVTNPCGVLHPRSSFKRSHDAPGWARSRMSLRSNGQPGPRARCVKSHDTGRGRRERGRKIDGTDKLLFIEITFISPRARGPPVWRFTKIHNVARLFNGRGEPSAFSPPGRDWGKMVSETDSS